MPTRNTRLGPNSRRHPKHWIVAFTDCLAATRRSPPFSGSGLAQKSVGATLANRKVAITFSTGAKMDEGNPDSMVEGTGYIWGKEDRGCSERRYRMGVGEVSVPTRNIKVGPSNTTMRDLLGNEDFTEAILEFLEGRKVYLCYHILSCCRSNTGIAFTYNPFPAPDQKLRHSRAP